MPASVLTQHNDNGRTGAIPEETILNASNVNVNQFGKLFECQVQGQIYAQPLYVPFVAIPGKGVHNVVYVATMENRLYAFDADDHIGPNAQPLWEHQLDPHPVPANIYKRFDRGQNRYVGGYADVLGDIGILSTPVIDARIGTSAADPSTGTLYLVLASWDPALFQQGGNKSPRAFRQLLFAVNLSNGTLRPAAAGQSNPVAVDGSVKGVGYAEARATERQPIKVNGGATLKIDVDGQRDIPVVDSANNKVF